MAWPYEPCTTPGKAALFQICDKIRIYLLHIGAMDSFTPKLVETIKRPNVIELSVLNKIGTTKLYLGYRI
ncbi:hypothetical protein OE88DRAFT_1657164 [Heliocybe sulcata]|uniref:Uncharacterized protein n=1 Tax=Heliocybe sulcata TaxID=5364 RepID=A0A5C3NI27_9AGAM|nr:hypothetical protein OE88DRAFT_1657164 [Heliocybe sulcata]